MEEKKEFTQEEVAKELLNKAKDLVKSEISVREAAAQIKGDKKVNEVLPEVAPDKRDDVLKEVREMEKADPRNQTSAQMAEVKIPQPKAPGAQEKVIAKQPLQLKKFMEKCQMKKSDKSREKGVHQPHFMAGKGSGDSEIGARMVPGIKPSEGLKNFAVAEHKKVIAEQKEMPKPNLPKSEKGK